MPFAPNSYEYSYDRIRLRSRLIPRARGASVHAQPFVWHAFRGPV